MAAEQVAPGALPLALWINLSVALSVACLSLARGVIYQSRLHLFVGTGWLVNTVYLLLEFKVANLSATSTAPFLCFVLTLLPFFLARAELSQRTHWSLALEFLIGAFFSLLPFALPAVSSYELRTAAGAIFSGYAFLAFGVAAWRVPARLMLAQGRRSDLLTTPLARGEVLPAETLLYSELEAHSSRLAKKAQLTIVIASLAFGALQLAYPLKPLISAVSPLIWPALFILGAVLKGLWGVGFVMMAAAAALLVEARLRRGVVAEDLNTVTRSVEHDMRAPLAQLRRVVLDIKDRYGSDKRLVEVATDLDKIRGRMKAVLELIIMFREGGDEYRSEVRRIDIRSALQQAVSAAKAQHPSRVIHVEPNHAAVAPVVRAYEARLIQVFTNLLNNAVEASPDKEHVKVVVQLTTLGGAVLVDIVDFGTGISPEDLPYVKEPYFSSKNSSQAVNRGLGLFIADRIVGMHGGRLDIQSQPGRTVARVTLPLAEARA